MPHLTRRLALASAALLCLGAAQAQTWPTKPIRAVVPFAAGSATDQIGRAFAEKMSATLGQAIVIENKPGASGMLGADTVAKAPADGYTILIGTNSTNAALKFLMKQLPYDQDKAFTPVGFLGSVPLMVAVNNDVPAKTLKEFVDLATSKPGQVSFAYASTSQQVSSEMLASMAGVTMNPIPYKSGPAAMTDLIGGQVNMFSADFGVTVPQHKAGKIRGLAVTSMKRSAAVPDLPTVNEALGLKDYELIAYFAVFAPAGTPPEVVVNKLNAAINAAAAGEGPAGQVPGHRLRHRPRHARTRWPGATRPRRSSGPRPSATRRSSRRRWHHTTARRKHHPALSASAGSAPARSADTGHGQCRVDRARPDAQDRHGGRCHLDCGTELDQERPRTTRPRDAPDQKRQPVALWHEGLQGLPAKSMVVAC
jgi:tripartite-type tricarboxylate transporter receptor subunit TctC